MGIAENKQVVLDFYAAAAKGDMDAAVDLLADDLVWTNTGTTRFSGTFHGKDVVLGELVGPLFALLRSGIASDVQQLTAEGDTVVAQTRGSAETLDGRPYNNTYCQVMTIRDGKIVAVTEYMDTALIDAVFGSE